MKRPSNPWRLVVAACAAAFAACGDETGIREKQIPALEVRSGGQLLVDGGRVYARADLPARLDIGNSGTGVLEIRAIAISSEPAGAFQVASLPMPSPAAPVLVETGGLPHRIAIEYHPEAAADAPATATVTITTNLTISGATQLAFTVLPEATVSRLVVAPPVLDFGDLEDGQSALSTANLLNTGAVPVSITRVSFTGSAGFVATIDGTRYAVADGEVTLATPIAIASGSAKKVDVLFEAAGNQSSQARMKFFTDDADLDGVLLKLYANVAGPCVSARPARLSFGGKLVGDSSEVALELQSCGDVELVISSIELVDDGRGQFSIDTARVGTFPLTIESGTGVLVPLRYFPVQVAPVVDGEIALDQGRLLVKSDSYLGDLEVPIDGFGTDGSCPIARIGVLEGDEVLPQTLLHLDGSGSSATDSTIATWEWSVVQPSGSVSVFLPSAAVPTPTFEPNIAGDYIFRLAVKDAAGVPSCSPAEQIVTVVPEDAIHVELVWRTPGDPDESDTGSDQTTFSAGSDVDLHFLHPDAFTWFDPVLDCYWDYPRQEWGAPGANDNPRLDRDDIDGGGPENLNMKLPENGATYRVAVHYWNHWGYGNARATVNVYIFGLLRERWSDVELAHDDLWEVLTIEWPGRAITRTGDGTPKITPKWREL